MKKVLFLVVTLALAASAVFASPSSQAVTGTKAAQSPTDPNLNLTGALIAKNGYRGFDFGMFFDNWENPPISQSAQMVETETGIKVDYTAYSSSTGHERAMILVNTGSYPELMGGWIFGTNDILKMAQDGVLLPIEDLVDKYSIYIKEAMNLPGVKEAITLADGHVYTFPYIVNEPTTYFGPWINQKYLDEVGLPMPTTTEEFKNVLIAFRDKIKLPNGQSIIPFSADPYNKDLARMAGYFGLASGSDRRHSGYMSYVSGQIDFTANKPQYREWIKWMADLYANKLIDPEIFTQTPDMFSARSKTFIYGSAISYGATAGHTPEIPGENLWTDYRPLPVLKAPGVTNPVWERINYGEPDKGVRNYNTQLVMTDKALGKEIAIIRWIDHLYNPDNIVRIQQGPLPGRSDLTAKYTKLTDRPYHYQWIDQTYWTEAQKKAYDYMWWGSLPSYGSKLTWEDAAGTPPRYKDMVDMQTLYAPYLETQLIPTKMAASATDTQRLSDIQPAIVDYVNGKMAEWISGQANVDAEWSAYLAQLDRLGVQELIQIKRRMAQ